MKICAMLKRSAGNDSVGDMWTETAEFDSNDTIDDVFRWAMRITGMDMPFEEYKRSTINITLAQLQKP